MRALDQDDLIRLLDDLSAEREARLAPKIPWTRARNSKFTGMKAYAIGWLEYRFQYQGVSLLTRS